MKLASLLFVTSSFVAGLSYGQDVQETFNGTRILNGHSVETIKARVLQFRIEHRFGDLAGANGGLGNFFGFDQAADIRFAFEYGITNDLMIGLGRIKGTGEPYNALLDGFIKYRVLHQNKEKGMPISLTVLGTSTMSYAKAQEDIALVQSYPEFSHRLAYSTQINIARKFGEHLSMSLMPTYVHRNYVGSNDVNGLFSLGAAINYKFSKGLGIILEYYPTFHDKDLRTDLSTSLSAGFEWTTNGHNFKVVCTNSRGFSETQFIPYTYSKWIDEDSDGNNVVGQFRLGFSISRNFNL
jgi:hypothetical protein